MPDCHYNCGRPLDVTDELGVWVAVWGWEQPAHKRASGKQGGSDIYNRRKFDRWAHADCIRREREGVSAAQETLV